MGVSLEGVDAQGEPWRISAESAAELGGRVLLRERLDRNGGLLGCLACGHPEVYTQPDFSRPLGIAIVIVAAALAPFTGYVSLFAAALLDAVLYWKARSMVVCYVCGTRHRGFAHEPRHPRYDLGVAERLRYGDKAVMGTPMRAGGTAGAPEPEH